MITKRRVVAVFVLLVLIFLLVSYSGIPQPPPKPDMKDFPREFIEPCVGLSEGDACTVRDFNGVQDSYYQLIDDMLVCFPQRMPPKEGMPLEEKELIEE